MRARIDHGRWRDGAAAERLCERDAAGERVGRTHEMREPRDTRDDRRRPKMHEDVRAAAQQNALVEAETERARECGRELLFHAAAL